MEDPRQCILEVKAEYIDYLVEKMFRSVYRGLQHQWEVSKKVTANNPENVFRDFQLRLASMKNLNDMMLKEDYERVLTETSCEGLEDIIQRCVVLSTQALATVNQPTSTPIKLRPPRGEHFLHRCYVFCARDLVEKVLWMEDRRGHITSVERCRNLERVYKLIKDCIRKSVKYFVPWDELAKVPLNVQGSSAHNNSSHVMFGPQGWSQKSNFDGSSGLPYSQTSRYPHLDYMFKPEDTQPQYVPQAQHETPSEENPYQSHDTNYENNVEEPKEIEDDKDDYHHEEPQIEHVDHAVEDSIASSRNEKVPPIVNDAMEKVIYFESQQRSKSPISETEDVSIHFDQDKPLPVESVYDESNSKVQDLSVVPMSLTGEDEAMQEKNDNNEPSKSSSSNFRADILKKLSAMDLGASIDDDQDFF
jgi:hypothetical protein